MSEQRCPGCGGETKLVQKVHADGWRSIVPDMPWCERNECLVEDCPGERRKADRRKGEPDSESLRCSCEWMSPEDGSVDATWPAVLHPECPIH